MALVISCVLAAGALPYLFLALSGWPSRTLPSRWGAGYDNRDPRESQARLTGWRRRAHLAQLNGYESFAPFAFGMLCAQLTGVPASLLATLGGAFLVLRVLHGIFYMTDQAALRSVSWILGITSLLVLYVQALLRVL